MACASLAAAKGKAATTASVQDPGAAVDLLTGLGVFRSHEPLQLLRRGVPLHYPARLVDAAHTLLASPPGDPDAALRVDLTHLAAFTSC